MLQEVDSPTAASCVTEGLDGALVPRKGRLPFELRKAFVAEREDALRCKVGDEPLLVVCRALERLCKKRNLVTGESRDANDITRAVVLTAR